VIFATNLAANFDPAFERRIRTHVLFDMPGVDEREQIWRVQMHPTLTPLADDVDFRKLAETYEASGGDIRNAVLKAALTAAMAPKHDTLKLIHQEHLEEGIRDVIAGKKVMKQSLFNGAGSHVSHHLVDHPTLIPSQMAVYAVAMAGFALLLAVVALLLTLLR
jgi:AAA+ superfamily predicted ATPase